MKDNKDNNAAAVACKKAGLINAKVAAIVNATREEGDEMDFEGVAALTRVLNNILYLVCNDADDDKVKDLLVETVVEITALTSTTELTVTDTLVSLLSLSGASMMKLSEPQYWQDRRIPKEEFLGELRGIMKDITKPEKEDES